MLEYGKLCNKARSVQLRAIGITQNCQRLIHKGNLLLTGLFSIYNYSKRTSTRTDMRIPSPTSLFYLFSSRHKTLSEKWCTSPAEKGGHLSIGQLKLALWAQRFRWSLPSGPCTSRDRRILTRRWMTGQDSQTRIFTAARYR